MKKKVIMAGAAVIMSVMAVFGYITTKFNSEMSGLINANIEAMTGDEIDKDHNFAKNVYCTVPAGKIGCKSALTRECTVGVFCNK